MRQNSRHLGSLLSNGLDNQSNFEAFQRGLPLKKQKQTQTNVGKYLFLKILS